MTLKRNVSLYVSLIFSLIFGISAAFILVFFASFRKDEFVDRLEQKALTTAKLLIEVKEIDNALLRRIDENTINKMHNEKVLVFDEDFKLIYTSIDEIVIKWNRDDLELLKQKKKFYHTQGKLEVMGMYYHFEQNEYYVLIAAEDLYGNRKMQFLVYVMLSTYLIALFFVWLSSYYIVSKLLGPLELLEREISNITTHNLHRQIETRKEDAVEISALADSFNKLQKRIGEAFGRQREFNSNASHELRTPIHRMMLQVESLLAQENLSETATHYLQNINTDLNQMAEILQSLMLLAQYGDSHIPANAVESLRIDDLIFRMFEKVQQTYPDLRLSFELIANQDLETDLEIKGQKSLLEVVFHNLLKNAAQYATSPLVYVSIARTSPTNMRVQISNQGNPISEATIGNLFQAFVRGENAKQLPGSGLGLRIVKRILEYHNAEIRYELDAKQTHLFVIDFPL